MASGQKTYIEKQAEQEARERKAKAKALKAAEDKEVHDRIKAARKRAKDSKQGMDSARIQERFVRRVGSHISKEFNGLLKARHITQAGKDSTGWRTGKGPAARANVTVYPDGADEPELQAYTDFNTASCVINSDKAPRFNQRQAVKFWSARIRGAMYHEVGHMQFSIPPRTVMRRAKVTLDELRVIEPNLKACDKSNHLRGDTVLDHQSLPKFHYAWNVLEDQRMEAAVVRTYPYAPKYLIPLITKVIIMDSDQKEMCWLLVGGRKYLPVEIRDACMARFNQWFATQDQAVQSLLHTDQSITPAEQWLGIVDDYKAATTCTDMFVAVAHAMLWLETINMESDDTSHNNQEYEEINDGEAGAREKGGSTSGDNEVTDVRPAEEEEDDDEEEEDSEDEGGPQAGNTNGPPQFNSLDDVAKQVLKDSLGDLPKDTMAAESTREAEGNDLLPYDREYRDLPDDWVTKSQSVSVGIERALQAFVTNREPIWRGRQTAGVLDPLAYRTRETGAIDYRRFLDDEGKEGMDVHVSMLCDNSGSMGSNMGALSSALLAMSTACERVGAGFDIILWSTEYFRLDRDQALSPWLYPSMGGTQVMPALLDLENSPVGQHVQNHLVLIFTDGEWYDRDVNLQNFQPSRGVNRKYVLAKYGHCGSSNYGADSVVQLNDIMDFPQLLESGLRELASVRT